MISRIFCYISLTFLGFIWLMGVLAFSTEYSRYYRDEPPTLTLAEAKQRLKTQNRIWVRIKDVVWFCNTLKPISSYRSSATKIIFTDRSGSDIVFAEFSGLFTCDELQNRTANGTLSIIESPDRNVLKTSQTLSRGNGLIFELCGHCSRADSAVGGVFVICVFPIIMIGIFASTQYSKRKIRVQ